MGVVRHAVNRSAGRSAPQGSCSCAAQAARKMHSRLTGPPSVSPSPGPPSDTGGRDDTLCVGVMPSIAAAAPPPRPELPAARGSASPGGPSKLLSPLPLVPAPAPGDPRCPVPSASGPAARNALMTWPAPEQSRT